LVVGLDIEDGTIFFFAADQEFILVLFEFFVVV